MTIQEANEMYHSTLYNTTSYLGFIGIGMIIFGVLGLIIIPKMNSDNYKFIVLVIFSLMILAGFITVAIAKVQFDFKQEENMNKFEEKVEKEIIEKLPNEKIEIKEYVILRQKEVLKSSKFLKGNKENSSIVEIIYMENGIKMKETIEANVKRTDGKKTPYIKTHRLKNNIPEKEEIVIFEKGLYNTTLFIPE